MTRAEDVAWAAGLFEGEGCMSTFNKKHLIRAACSSTDPDVLMRFREIVGLGKIAKQRDGRAKHPKTLWIWTANMGEAEEVIRLLAPFLGLRRFARAAELVNARQAHIEDVTRERECPGCGFSFRPVYGANSARQTHCTTSCYYETTDRVRRRLAERRRNPHWKAVKTP